GAANQEAFGAIYQHRAVHRYIVESASPPVACVKGSVDCSTRYSAFVKFPRSGKRLVLVQQCPGDPEYAAVFEEIAKPRARERATERQRAGSCLDGAQIADTA